MLTKNVIHCGTMVGGSNAELANLFLLKVCLTTKLARVPFATSVRHSFDIIRLIMFSVEIRNLI